MKIQPPQYDFPESYFDPAAPIGEWVRYHHDCSNKPDKSLSIIRTPKGWGWKCHRCGIHGFKSARGLSPEEMIKWKNTISNKPYQEEKEVQLPPEFTENIPPEGLAWLYTMGLTDTAIKEYGIGYSPVYDRVILLVYDDEELVAWHAKSLGITKPEIIYMRKKGMPIYFKVQKGHSRVVIVDNIFAAIKIGQFADSYGLMTIKLSDALAKNLANRYDKILVWLGPRKERKVSKFIIRQRALGYPVSAIKSDKNPKILLPEEIGEYL